MTRLNNLHTSYYTCPRKNNNGSVRSQEGKIDQRSKTGGKFIYNS